MPLPSRPLPPHGILWPYKSQRKATNQGGTKEIKKQRKQGNGPGKQGGERQKNQEREREGQTKNREHKQRKTLGEDANKGNSKELGGGLFQKRKH